MPIDRKPIFDAFRAILRGRNEPGFTNAEVAQIDRAFDMVAGAQPGAAPQIGLTRTDFLDAAAILGCSVAQIKAVWEVECSGQGWFTDVRGDILNLDGPGGFIDGTALPKILFEAHHFARYTKGKYNLTYPNLSSPKWNRKLYIGGQGEWIRLWKAMTLDHDAALMSASVGAPQIMGFNYKMAGYGDVQSFWDAMMKSERNQLLAFVSFIQASYLVAELKAISASASTCRDFARGYNGTGFEANDYHGKIARAFAKYS